MRKITLPALLAAGLLVMALPACAPDSLSPMADAEVPEAAAEEPCDFFAPYCMDPTTIPMIDASGNTQGLIFPSGSMVSYGNLVLENYQGQMTFTYVPGGTWRVSSFSAYYGNASGVPQSSGQFDETAFPIHLSLTPFTAGVQGACSGAIMDVSPGCNLLIATASIHTVSAFGQMTNVRQVWAQGDPLSEGFGREFCVDAACGVVLPELNTPCAHVLLGWPASECTTLSVTTVNGSTDLGAFDFQWSNGATTSTITVCPAVTTTYTVTVSSAAAPALFQTASATVHVTDIRCGNGNGQPKILVCSTPPGQTQCLPLTSATQMIHAGNAAPGPCGLVNPCE